jgi:DNA-binding transcriptional LysR family regulator
MNLEYLRTFVTIVEQGGLSAAARAKRISQPAVTKQYSASNEIGLLLLVRGARRPLELTSAGERLLVFARETSARLKALERELAALKAIGLATLGFAASTIPGEHVLPALLAEFRKAHPGIAGTWLGLCTSASSPA